MGSVRRPYARTARSIAQRAPLGSHRQGHLAIRPPHILLARAAIDVLHAPSRSAPLTSASNISGGGNPAATYAGNDDDTMIDGGGVLSSENRQWPLVRGRRTVGEQSGGGPAVSREVSHRLAVACGCGTRAGGR
ncbi:hypothetical protein HPB47_001122 [Ixodes persulcatus]|uniref:Uncharacterized protein n=1 Tax=Ixodes persulcatus TaxID=34615 RepID=A0AC60PPW9_IXOPE|nr:hypothetical protein HPB47_001122 [Ixodes persulcatus]